MTRIVIGNVSDVHEGELIRISAGGKDILITRINGKYFAMNNICNHAGAELHEGKLNGTEVECPWHGAKWDITNGKLVWFPQKLNPEDSYKVVIEDDTLLIDF